MKVVAILLSLCFTLNVFASSNLTSDVHRTIDDYQYAMTVDWDQNDRTFAEARTRKLFSEISSFFAQGMTSDDLLKIVESKIKNPAIVAELRMKAQTLPTGSQEELIQALADSSSSFYSEGASWNGTAVAFYGGLAVFFIGFIAYTTWYNANYECVEYELRYHNVCVRYEKKN